MNVLLVEIRMEVNESGSGEGSGKTTSEEAVVIGQQAREGEPEDQRSPGLGKRKTRVEMFYGKNPLCTQEASLG